MYSLTFLAVLKYAGILISGASSIWALISKTTYEDESGRKRLTLSGQISIGITIFSSVVGLLAYGFDESAKREAAKAVEEKEVRRRADEKSQQQQRDRSREQRDWQLRQEQHSDAERQTRRQELAIIEASSRQKERDAVIARNVATGNAQTLARMAETLRDLDRLARPIYPISLGLSASLSASLIKDDAILSAIEESAKRSSKDAVGEYTVIQGGENKIAQASKRWQVISGAAVKLLFFKSVDEAQRFVEKLGVKDSDLEDGDLRISVRLDGPTLYSANERGELPLLKSDIRVDPLWVTMSGKIQSTLDLHDAALVIYPDLQATSFIAPEVASQTLARLRIDFLDLRMNGTRILLPAAAGLRFIKKDGLSGILFKQLGSRFGLAVGLSSGPKR